MADDDTQRPYRSNEPPTRSASGKTPGSSSDPLVELARLIGQNDPFSEYGRDAARRSASPQTAYPDTRAPATNPSLGDNGYYAAPPAQPPLPGISPYAPTNYARQQYGGTPLATEAEHYPAEADAAGFPPAEAGDYEHDPYNQNMPQHLTGEEEGYYDDARPSRRRMGIMIVAGVFALAVIGTAGAFGYRSLFGSGSSHPPPVIKADTVPSKIVPAVASKDAQSNKTITDRINDRGQAEKLVSRQEQPLDIKDKSSGIVFPQGQNDAPPSLGSGVVGSEPKKIRTIAIHPDQAVAADATPTSAPATVPARVATVAPAKQAPPLPQPPPRVANNPPPAADPEPAPAPNPPVTRAAPAVAAPAPSNAPLSLNPNAPASRAAAPARPAAPPAPPARTAAVAPTASAPAAASAAAAAGTYAVQVSSQRSEAEAQAAFRSLQGKFPAQLGGKKPLIHRVDLGDKGIYFRTMVGPFTNGTEASELCASLKAAGGSCIIQRN